MQRLRDMAGGEGSNRSLTYDIVLAKAPTQYRFLILDDVRFTNSHVRRHDRPI